MKPRVLAIIAAMALAAQGIVVRADAVKTQVQPTATGFQLIRDGKPYFIQGAGGDASKQLLVDCGGNSFRTWGADNIDDKLAEAQKLGLTVTIGIWLRHDKNFSYNNNKAVRAQLQMAKDAIMKYKDNPVVLMWAIGNEMEGYKDGGDPAVWANVEAIAAFAHKVDPNHPTMTVIAEIGGDRVGSINDLAPDIDVVGINSYGGGPSLADRYRKAGGVKPYVITEFGPGGTWEVGKNDWGVPIELTSTAKADAYRATYEKSILAEKDKLCLGSYVFTWGAKQEATATWYGLFLADGTRLEGLDTMTELWSGKKPAVACPQIKPLTVNDSPKVDPGGTIKVSLDTSSPSNDTLKVKWVLTKDMSMYDTGGDVQPTPPMFPEAIASGDLKGCELHMPKDGGGYWLYAYVYDTHGGAAMANTPLFVNGPVAPLVLPTSELPLAVYEDGMTEMPYIWSGWMGKVDAIAMDEKWADNPHSGKVCMKCQFNSNDGFGGIVWQSPANDWGDAPGGKNLTGATKLTFWARGDTGGESVNFSLGVIGKDRPFHDSDSAALKDVVLTKDWQQYTIDLTGKDLTCIKTGFVWVVGAKGKPVTFYLDDIRYEK
jgi:Glycosyl hydrolases family 2, TIM barrel domain